jgi:fibronectin-binding autotransporter adhesin
MKPKPKSRALSISSLTTVIFVGFLVTGPALHAADLTWDAGNTANGATIDPASGNWNVTAGNIVWNNAGTNVIWSQTSTTDGSNTAIFAGTDGTLNQYVVTLAAQMAAESITFNNSGYQITGSTLALMPTATTSGAITVAAGKTATINSILRYAHNTAASVVVDSGSVLNLGGGTTASNNPQFSFAGAGTVNITAGTYASNIGSVGNAIFNQTGGIYNITPGNNAGFNITSATQNVAYNLSAGTLSVNGNNTTPTVNNSFLGIGNGTSSNTSSLNVSGTSILNVGTIASRSGEIRIGNTNASNGTLNVSGGTVTVGTGSATNRIYFFKAGSGGGFTAAMTQSDGTVTANGIQFGASTGATTYDATSAANLTLTGGTLYIGAAGITKGTDAASLATTIKLEAGTLGADQNWSSSLNMEIGASTIRAQDAASAARNITLSGVLSDVSGQNGKITKTGTGILTLSNTDNTFTGQVLSDSGTIQVTKLANSGTVSSTGAGVGSIRLGNNATATLEYIGTTDSSADKVFAIGTSGVTNTGSAAILNNGSGKLTFTAANFTQVFSTVTAARSLTIGGSYTGAANEIQGVIRDHNTDGGGIVSVNKTDASTWVLSGTNTYTGATNVTGGVLAVNGSLANTTTTVGTGATLGGSGSIGGSVTVQGGGTLAAGNSIESLSSGALSLEALSTFAYEIDNDAAANVAGDLTAVTGNLTIDLGNTVNLTLGELGSGLWVIGEKLTLISYSGTWNGGLFNYGGTLADDSTLTFSGMEWLFNYNDTAAGTNYTGDLTGSRFVTMTAIPEPSAALLGGLGLLALLRRRRN